MTKAQTRRARADGVVLRALADGADLQATLEALHAETRLRVAILDLNGRVIAAAPRGVAWHTLSALAEAKPSAAGADALPVFEHLREVRVPPEPNTGNYHTLCIPLLQNDLPDALAAVQYRAEGAAELAKYLLELLGRLHTFFRGSRPEPLFGEDAFHNNLARLLLADDADSTRFPKTVWGAYCEQAELLPPGYALLMIRAQTGQSDAAQLRAAASELSGLLPRALRLLSGESLTMLVAGLSWEQADCLAALCRTLRPVCERNRLVCGVSLPFGALTQCTAYRRQAADTLRLGIQLRREPCVFSADAYLPELTFRAGAEALGVRTLLLEDIRILEESDRQHNTTFLETLEAYLTNDNRVSAAARELFIDRSTLNYRLRKIEKLIGAELDDPAIARSLRYSLAIRRLSETAMGHREA